MLVEAEPTYFLCLLKSNGSVRAVTHVRVVGGHSPVLETHVSQPVLMMGGNLDSTGVLIQQSSRRM